jgi:glucosamine kinase
MILIADSGATKTDWRLEDADKRIHQFRSKGIYPFIQNSYEIAEFVKIDIASKINNLEVGNVFYYGTGCSSEENKNTVRSALAANFPNAKIIVNHDLLGAARSLCQHDAGIAAILGTGSNSCYYDGENIIENVPSLGYILGDEGSGAHIGKKFLKHYFEKELPPDIHELFFNTYHLTNEVFLDNVYGKPFANRYLASFVPFLLRHIQHPFIAALLYDSFSDFFNYQVCKYSRHKEVITHFTGSVAFYFADIVRQAANDKNIRIGTITESPIAGLTLFHCQK